MSMKLMYITNRPDIAQIVENEGVDRIFVDLEYIGKDKRQGGMDTVQSKHDIVDIANIAKVINKSELLVRVNPIHAATDEYNDSKSEIDAVICAGADIIMLPYFKSVDEVKEFLCWVDGRTKTMLLVETPEAVEIIDNILQLRGIDELFIGLNDLSLGYHKKFMFELLADGTVEQLCLKFKKAGIPYGFGGIASPGKGALPAEYIIREHYRLGSSCSILSRSFCNTEKINDLCEIKKIFSSGIEEIRTLERECEERISYFVENEREVLRRIRKISEELS